MCAAIWDCRIGFGSGFKEVAGVAPTHPFPFPCLPAMDLVDEEGKCQVAGKLSLAGLQLEHSLGIVRVRVGVRATIGVRTRTIIRVHWGLRLGLGCRAQGGLGLLPTTSHSIFYSRFGPIAIFISCQP